MLTFQSLYSLIGTCYYLMVQCSNYSPNMKTCESRSVEVGRQNRFSCSEGRKSWARWYLTSSGVCKSYAAFYIWAAKTTKVSYHLHTSPCLFHAWCTNGKVPFHLCVTADSCVRPWRDAADSVAFRCFFWFSIRHVDSPLLAAHTIYVKKELKIWIWIGCESKCQRIHWLTYSHLTYVRTRALSLPQHCRIRNFTLYTSWSRVSSSCMAFFLSFFFLLHAFPLHWAGVPHTRQPCLTHAFNCVKILFLWFMDRLDVLARWWASGGDSTLRIERKSIIPLCPEFYRRCVITNAAYSQRRASNFAENDGGEKRATHSTGTRESYRIIIVSNASEWMDETKMSWLASSIWNTKCNWDNKFSLLCRRCDDAMFAGSPTKVLCHFLCWLWWLRAMRLLEWCNVCQVQPHMAHTHMWFARCECGDATPKSTCDPLLYPMVGIADYVDDDGFNKLKTICLVCRLAGLRSQWRQTNDNVAENKQAPREMEIASCCTSMTYFMRSAHWAQDVFWNKEEARTAFSLSPTKLASFPNSISSAVLNCAERHFESNEFN